MSDLTVLGKKWICEYCTYENWQASKKCTLCRAPRPPVYINEEAPTTPPFEQDIYKMAPLVSSPTTPSPPASTLISPSHGTKTVQCGSTSASTVCSGTPLQYSDTSHSNKWACQVCTYLNWPKSQKCTQCLTVRPKVIPVASRTAAPAIQESSKPLSINVNITENSCPTSGAGSGTSRSSPRMSPNSPESAKALNNDKNHAVAAASVKMSGKWNCKACTYENWPKSYKCVLCGVPKGRTYLDLAHGADRPMANEGSILQRSRSNSNLSKRRSPPSSARSPESIEIQALGGATASPNIYQEKQDRNKTLERTRLDERKLRQFRNCLCDTDWMWLNACEGVVEGNALALEAYLASGGDPARQLTPEESTFLNRPSAFQSGYTLVHLAIRFDREDMLAVVLSATDVAAKGKKRVPSHVSPDVAAEIQRQISASLRKRKGDFPCYFLTELATFSLPAGESDFHIFLLRTFPIIKFLYFIDV